MACFKPKVRQGTVLNDTQKHWSNYQEMFDSRNLIYDAIQAIQATLISLVRKMQNIFLKIRTPKTYFMGFKIAAILLDIKILNAMQL